jgi:hypothetical protein
VEELATKYIYRAGVDIGNYGVQPMYRTGGGLPSNLVHRLAVERKRVVK